MLGVIALHVHCWLHSTYTVPDQPLLSVLFKQVHGRLYRYSPDLFD